MAILTWLGVPGAKEQWEALNFRFTDDGGMEVGDVYMSPGTEAAWGFDEIHSDPAALGVPTRTKPLSVTKYDALKEGNWNGIDRIDHVVYAVPELDPAVDTLTAVLGEGPRRRAFPRGPSGPEMAFFVVGDCFIEVVASGQPAALWGIAFNSPDLDWTVTTIRAKGGPVGDPKPSVQGGRIASVWKGHLDWGVAIMEPPKR